jgi:iron complex outermembrane receptor protein
MMTGLPALEFANTDAELVGFDLAWGYALSERFSLEGMLSYVEGKRTDVADRLYRIAPLNGSVSLVLEQRRFSGRLELLAYARQDKVAAYNAEPETPGYGIVNARMQWSGNDALRVYASLENLLDKSYQAHLGGFNRVGGVDVPLGERLYGIGRNFNVGIGFHW